MKNSESLNEIAKALSSLQGDMKPAIKDTVNPFFKSRFSSINSMWDAIRDLVKKYELTVVQELLTYENGVSVITKVMHSSGQWIEFGPLEMPVIKKDPQGVGSASSYAKRYALSAALGIVSDDDDDGEGAQRQHRKAEELQALLPPSPPELIILISSQQLKILRDMLDLCDHDYQKKVYDYLKNSHGIETLDKMPLNLYGQVEFRLKAQLEKIAETSSSHVRQESEQVDEE